MKKIISAIVVMACLSYASAQSVVFDSVFIMNSATDSIITAVKDLDEFYLGADSVLGNAANCNIWVVLSPGDLKSIDVNYKCYLRLEKDGVTLNETTETNVPYALYGDNPDVDPWDFFDGVYLDAGEYILVIAFVNGAGGPLVAGTDYVYITFEVIDEYPPVGNVEQPAKKTLEIYPNPFTTNLMVKTGNEISQISVTSLVGKEILTFNNINEQQYTIDLSGLAAGVYLIAVVESNNNIKVQKLIKR
jgi:hypothetical protein